jgi:hypothetical protein
LLTHTAADLAQVEGRFQAVVNRLAEVREAEAHMVAALQLTEEDLERAIALCSREDAKIGREVEQQIEQARGQLAKAQELAEEREFIAAVDAQAQARQLATAAYMAADEQVRAINALQAQLETAASSTHDKIVQALTFAEELPPVAQTASTNQFGRQLQDHLSLAERVRAATTGLEDRALAEGLREAIGAYEEASQMAEWMIAQVITDRQEYEFHADKTRTTLSDARAAIQLADQILQLSEAGGARRHALRRARLILPPEESIEGATIHALIRLAEQAEDALKYARKAKDW